MNLDEQVLHDCRRYLYGRIVDVVQQHFPSMSMEEIANVVDYAWQRQRTHGDAGWVMARFEAASSGKLIPESMTFQQWHESGAPGETTQPERISDLIVEEFDAIIHEG
ncbi:MAG: hypothetical protein ACT4O6_12630 [Reyranella sp.]